MEGQGGGKAGRGLLQSEGRRSVNKRVHGPSRGGVPGGFNCASSGDNQKLNRSRLRSCWSNARDEGSYTNSAHTSRDKYNLSYVYAVVKFEEQNK